RRPNCLPWSAWWCRNSATPFCGRLTAKESGAMQLSANLSWLYRHLDWKDRFGAAAQDGFPGVEILLPYEHPPAWYAERLNDAGLVLNLINPRVGGVRGGLGWAAIPGARERFEQAYDRARGGAHAIGCRCIHVMAGDTSGLPPEACMDAL